MKTRTNVVSDTDEVERCRQVRRTLERTHGTLEGLCRWLKKLEVQEKRTSRTAKRKQAKRGGQKTKKE
jgi:hypothetical protein